MKKLFSLLFVLSIFTVFGGSALASENLTEDTVPSMLDEKVIEILQENEIEYTITEDNQIQLVHPTSGDIEFANNLLKEYWNQQEFFNLTSYPTPWVEMRQYEIHSNNKFEVATKSAFAAAVSMWLIDKTSSYTNLAKYAAAAFGTYYFVNTHVETVYYNAKYYYRELGPGFFNDIGNFIGEYEIRKIERLSKNPDYTGGQIETTNRESSILIPFF